MWFSLKPPSRDHCQDTRGKDSTSNMMYYHYPDLLKETSPNTFKSTCLIGI